MPWEIKHKKERKGKKWCIYNKHTGKLMGCSETKEDAEQHLAALYANVKD